MAALHDRCAPFHHLLHGSASTVLTATRFPNGNPFDSPPIRPPSLTDRQKFVTADYVDDSHPIPNLMQILPWGGCLSANRWNITINLCLPSFGELTYMSDHSANIRAWWLKRRGHKRDVTFGVSLILLPDFGGTNETSSQTCEKIFKSFTSFKQLHNCIDCNQILQNKDHQLPFM